MAKAANAFEGAKRLFHRLANADSNVFDRVVHIDMQVAFGFHG
jgi:hypothetical protein